MHYAMRHFGEPTFEFLPVDSVKGPIEYRVTGIIMVEKSKQMQALPLVEKKIEVFLPPNWLIHDYMQNYYIHQNCQDNKGS